MAFLRSRRSIRHLACLMFFLPSFGHAGVLEQLVSSALCGHPTIQAQQAQEEAARANTDSAAWQFFPAPSVAIEKAQVNQADRAYSGDDMVTTLRLQQPLWTGGRLTAGKEKAEAGVLASRALLEETRQQIALRVVQAYGDWLAAHLKTQANEKSMATHVRLRDQVKRRIEQGVSAESDLTLAIARLESVDADIAVSLAQKNIALSRLEQLLGQPVDSAALREIAVPQPINSSLRDLLGQALAIHPAIQKARAQASVQKSVIAERRADLAPDVYLRAEQQRGNYSYNNTSAENRLFLGLSSHLGAGLSGLSNLEGAQSQHRAALAEVEAQGRTVNEQVQSDHALAASAESRLKALRNTLNANEQVLESFGRQFLAGRKTWLDVMNAARELAQTEMQLADIRATQVIVTWRLAIYTQGLAALVVSKQ